MYRCTIAHQVPLGGGLSKDFEAGTEYPDTEIGDREKYFERIEKPPVKAERKITEEVAEP